jgi:inner membrane protein involved in colicin E2 resistance
MSDEIVSGGFPESAMKVSSTRKLIPMQVGNATVYIVSAVESAEVEPTDDIYAVAVPSPKEAFENGLEIIKECIGTIGVRLEEMAEKLRPQELSVEFSIAFEGTGKARIIPLLVTAETKGSTGLKITAKWQRPEAKGSQRGAE